MSILRYILFVALFAALPVAAQQDDLLWRDSEPAQQSAALNDLLPVVVSYQRSVVVAADTVSSLNEGGTVRVELLPRQFRQFEIRSSRQYLNGDVGYSAVTIDGEPLAQLSLVVNELSVLASIDNGRSQFTLRAIRTSTAENNFSGYLYSQDNLGTYAPIDNGGVISAVSTRPDDDLETDGSPTSVLAISGNDVSIEQTLTPSFAKVGDQVDVTVEVTNNTASTLSGEQLTVLFALEFSELISSSAICTTGNIGLNFGLICDLPDIAASASTSINYSVRLTEQSYPFISSGVFVGDVFGTENVRDDDFVFVIQDTLTDSDGDGLSDFNEAIVNTDPNSAASTLAPGTVSEIDLMFLYTPKFVEDIGNVQPETKINELVEVTNAYYANSRVNVEFRPVLYRLVNYDVNNNLNTAFTAMQDAVGEFSFVPEVRTAVGADIVILIDGLFFSDSLCGLGTTPGIGFEGEFFHPTIIDPELYVTLYTDGFPTNASAGCDNITLAHELGHNHGLDHSHREEGAEGTFSWALGHGVDGSFATIMANPADFPGSDVIALFSNPESTDCNGLPCGVSRDDVEQGADAVYTLNHTNFQIANRRQSRILPTTSMAGGSNLTIYGAATINGATDTAVSSISESDALDVRATLGIPLIHQGTIGETYVVISVAGVGLFFRDAAGGYQPWDGELSTLQPNAAAHALSVTEELIAFENFVPAAFDVSSAELTVFFAYAIPDTSVFVYSSNGISVTIQP
ncbi:MAG: M12 family metallo-peptidase [Pseudomonadales bacterium]|nr:M12 family metallo-peptidase [Pseudomonadales bacterium]